MRIPNDSLEDFLTGMRAAKPVEPPPVRVVLHFTGKIEVLKPVAHSVDLGEYAEAIGIPLVHPSGEAILGSWGRRSLAFAGAFAVILLVLVSGIFIGTNSSRIEPIGSPPDLVSDQRSEEISTPSNDPALSGPVIQTSSPVISEEPHTVRYVRRPSLATLRRAVYRPRRLVRSPQIVQTGFVPTTLIIYPENGEIKTRIEPQLTSSYKKPLTLSN